MGCFQSTTASRATIPGPGAAAPQQAAPPAAEATEAIEAPVLVEVSVRERAIGDLKSIFQEVSANEHGQVNKAELSTLLDNRRDLDVLMKQACMNVLADVASTLIRNGGEQITWEEFLILAENVGHELKEFAVEEAKHDVEQLGEALAAEVAAAEEAKDKVLAWLKDIFESFTRDEDGAVSKEELEARLKEDDELDGESIAALIGRSGFNPLWKALSAIATNKGTSISWEELQAHILGPAKEDEKMELVIEDTSVTQGYWGCC